LEIFSPLSADQNVTENAARDLPAGFSEAFDVALRSIGEFQISTTHEIARDRALASFYGNVRAKTGVQLPLYCVGGNVSLDELSAAIGKLPQLPGDTDPSYAPLSEIGIDGMALQRMRQARQDAAAFARRETTWGGTFGTIAGWPVRSGRCRDTVTRRRWRTRRRWPVARIRRNRGRHGSTLAQVSMRRRVSAPSRAPPGKSRVRSQLQRCSAARSAPASAACRNCSGSGRRRCP